MLLIPFFIAATAMSTPQPDARPRLSADWFVADVLIKKDGSTFFQNMHQSIPITGAWYIRAVNSLQFPPKLVDGRPVSFRTGLYARYHNVQNGRLRQITFENVFLSPLLLETPDISWPDGAWEQGLGGEVIMLLDIDASGSVANARVIAGDAPLVFYDGALAAARSLTFSPQVAGGEPMPSRAIVDIYYEARGRMEDIVETPADIPLAEDDEEYPWPIYRADLPYWRNFLSVDEDMMEALDAWEFHGISPDARTIPGSVISRRTLVPPEPRLFLLPDISESSREDSLE